MRTVKGNQQTAITRGKLHRYPSLGTAMGFITLRGVGRPPSFYSNVDMNLYLSYVCIGISVSTTRETKKREFNILATKMHLRVLSQGLRAECVTVTENRLKVVRLSTKFAGALHAVCVQPGTSPASP